MRNIRIALVAALTLCIAGNALAGDLNDSADKAAANGDQAETTGRTNGKARVETVGGLALFGAGMTTGLYAFINNKNGKFSEFGEAAATNKKLGAAGISLAFAGGMMMFLGTHASKHLPSLTFGKGSVGMTKQITW
ncbi:MAG TPA: hypothetical protein VF456_12500 [Vicinamibacterales bacterium]